VSERNAFSDLGNDGVAIRTEDLLDLWRSRKSVTKWVFAAAGSDDEYSHNYYWWALLRYNVGHVLLDSRNR
jgi:hypothetical protein